MKFDDSPYCHAFRGRFPDARFISAGSAREDFQTIRRARNIALSVGTYSWIAAYLSSAQSIHVPLCGVFDFSVRPQNDLLPTWDPRFVFHRVPEDAWTRRYADFQSIGVRFRRASRQHIRLRRSISNARLTIVRSRIRYGIERRLLAELLRNRGAVRAAKIIGYSAEA